MGKDAEKYEVEILERPEWQRKGFDEMTKEERQEMALRSVEMRRKKRELRQLAKLEAYTEAHRELASQILGTKMVLLDGLVDEMHDPETGELSTKRLDQARMKLLLQLLDQLQKTAFPPETKVKHEGSVDVRHLVAEINKGLARPDDV